MQKQQTEGMYVGIVWLLSRGGVVPNETHSAIVLVIAVVVFVVGAAMVL